MFLNLEASLPGRGGGGEGECEVRVLSRLGLKVNTDFNQFENYVF